MVDCKMINKAQDSQAAVAFGAVGSRKDAFRSTGEGDEDGVWGGGKGAKRAESVVGTAVGH
jgi:hypothetical protein